MRWSLRVAVQSCLERKTYRTTIWLQKDREDKIALNIYTRSFFFLLAILVLLKALHVNIQGDWPQTLDLESCHFTQPEPCWACNAITFFPSTFHKCIELHDCHGNVFRPTDNRIDPEFICSHCYIRFILMWLEHLCWNRKQETLMESYIGWLLELSSETVYTVREWGTELNGHFSSKYFPNDFLKLIKSPAI